MQVRPIQIFFFFNDTATPEIYPLPLHDALPISTHARPIRAESKMAGYHATEFPPLARGKVRFVGERSEEHTSELQSLAYLVCRLLLEKKNINRHRTQALYCIPRNAAAKPSGSSA